jgi:hypothetical protein
MASEAQLATSAARLRSVCLLGAAMLALGLYAPAATAQSDDPGAGSDYESNRGSFEPGNIIGPGEKPPPMEPVPGPPGMYGAFTESQSRGSSFYFTPDNLFGAPAAESSEMPKAPEGMLELGPADEPSQPKGYEDPYGRLP